MGIRPVRTARLGQQEESKVFAVVETGSKQYKVAPGDVIEVDRLPGEVNSEIRLEKVLLVSGEAVTVGTPVVQGATVRATITEQGKGDKVIVFRYKSKKRYRRIMGHRSLLTTLKIEEIVQG